MSDNFDLSDQAFLSNTPNYEFNKFGNLIAEYDASDLTTLVLNATNNVMIWKDKSGVSVNNKCYTNDGGASSFGLESYPTNVNPTASVEFVTKVAFGSIFPSIDRVSIISHHNGVQANSGSFGIGMLSLNGLPNIDSAGTIRFETDSGSVSSSVSLASIGMITSKKYWIKSFINSTGSYFFWSEDQEIEPTSWAQIGTDQPPITLTGGLHPFFIGYRGSDANTLNGNVYRAICRADGNLILDLDFNNITYETRKNLYTNSETINSISAGSTTLITNGTASINAAISPIGGYLAEAITLRNAVTSSLASNDGYAVTTVASVSKTYTFSMYAKANTYSTIRLREASNSGQQVIFDLISGSVSSGSGASNFYADSSSIENVGDGWYRIQARRTTTGASFNVSFRSGENGNGTGSIYVWGWQAEEGSRATSYQRMGTYDPPFTSNFGPSWTLNVGNFVIAPRITGERDLYSNLANRRPLYLPFVDKKYFYSGGGGWFSSSVAANNVTSYDIRYKATSPTAISTNPTQGTLLCKGTNGLQFYVALFSSGQVRFQPTTGSTTATALSLGSNAPIDPNPNSNIPYWGRIVSMPASGTVTYYNSTDNANSWNIMDQRTTSSFVQSTGSGGINVSQGSYNFTYLQNPIEYIEIRNAETDQILSVYNPTVDHVIGRVFTSSLTNETWSMVNRSTMVNRDCVFFDGNQQFIQSPYFFGGRELTYFIVGSPITYTSGDYIHDSKSGSVARFSARQNTSPDTRLIQGSDAPCSQSWDVEIEKISTFVYQNNNFQYRHNKLPAQVNSSISSITSDMNGFTLGSLANSASPANFKYSHVLIYSGSLSSDIQDKVVDTLAKKWKIAV